MIAAFKMPKEIGSTEDNSKILKLYFTHLNRVRHLARSLSRIKLSRNFDHFLSHLFRQGTIVIKYIVYEEKRVEVMRLFFSFQLCNKTFKLTCYIQQRVLPKAYILKSFISTYAIIKINVDKWFPRL